MYINHLGRAGGAGAGMRAPLPPPPAPPTPPPPPEKAVAGVGVPPLPIIGAGSETRALRASIDDYSKERDKLTGARTQYTDDTFVRDKIPGLESKIIDILAGVSPNDPTKREALKAYFEDKNILSQAIAHARLLANGNDEQRKMAKQIAESLESALQPDKLDPQKHKELSRGNLIEMELAPLLRTVQQHGVDPSDDLITVYNNVHPRANPVTELSSAMVGAFDMKELAKLDSQACKYLLEKGKLAIDEMQAEVEKIEDEVKNQPPVPATKWINVTLTKRDLAQAKVEGLRERFVKAQAFVKEKDKKDEAVADAIVAKYKTVIELK